VKGRVSGEEHRKSRTEAREFRRLSLLDCSRRIQRHRDLALGEVNLLILSHPDQVAVVSARKISALCEREVRSRAGFWCAVDTRLPWPGIRSGANASYGLEPGLNQREPWGLLADLSRFRPPGWGRHHGRALGAEQSVCGTCRG
jgi:hypothetical protein